MFPARSLLLLCLVSLSRAAVFTEPSQLQGNRYDFIVVGAGTAGNIVAARLSESPNVKVLVIEAGRSNEGYDSDLIKIPFLGPQASPFTSFDWNYTTVPQAALNNQVIPYPRGYVLGGSSSINYMVYTRCSIDDYNRFAEIAGDDGWSWNKILPYAIKQERHVPPNDNHNETGQYDPSIHGTHGPLLTSLPGFSQAIDQRVIATTQELSSEFPYNLDINSGNPLGVGWMHSTVGFAARSSSATAYLVPAVNARRNIDLLHGVQVTKLFQTGRSGNTPVFQGVEFGTGRNAPLFRLTASKEVILSAGAVGTPQILMLSGIGDPAELRSVGIQPIVELPEVGKNLQDHPLVPIQWTANSTTTMDPILQDPQVFAEAMDEYNVNKTGRLANNGVSNHMSFFRLPRSSPILRRYGDPTSGPRAPHYELAIGDGFFTTSQPIPKNGSYFSIINVVVAPTSRGTITLASSSPWDHPLIDPKLLNTPYDLAVMVESVKAAKRFAAAHAWDGYITGPYIDAVNTTTDAGIIDYIRKWGTTIKHPFSTAAVNKNPGKGVVSGDLTVKRVKGLRIVDASVFPFIPAGHPQAPVLIVAERAADVIKAAYRPISRNYRETFKPPLSALMNVRIHIHLP